MRCYRLSYFDKKGILRRKKIRVDEIERAGAACRKLLKTTRGVACIVRTERVMEGVYEKKETEEGVAQEKSPTPTKAQSIVQASSTLPLPNPIGCAEK